MRRRHSACGSPRRLAGAIERRLTRSWTRRRPQPFDRLMVGLSRAADHSVLWLVLAVLSASCGGPRGRRAARNGLLSLACASATANGPMKWAFRRRRPVPRRRLLRTPRTSSFPSGHSASAFAFATAATRELPEAGPVLLPLAAGVAYSRVYLGVHYPSDVMAGAAFGAAVGLAARPVAERLGLAEEASPKGERAPRSTAIMVVSPHAGNSAGLARARGELVARGVRVIEELDIKQLDRLSELLRATAEQPPLVIAAGGDGTVGSVAAQLVGEDAVLGVLPLGTGNDFARSLGIPINPRRAAELIATGEAVPVDLGRLTRAGRPPAYFAHAATVGLNVDFAKLATQASVRARLGRLTYLAAAVAAVRERTRFDCTLQHDGVAQEMTLLQLTVISARVVGGALGMNVRGPFPDDHRLDVIAVEDVPPHKMLRAGLFLLLGIKRPVAGIRAMHVERLSVDSPHPLGLTLDGELNGTIPGSFETAAGAVRVITPVQG